MEQRYRNMSPFEIKDQLINLARGHKKVTRTLLDAGRGNPNWVAATPREAFFTLGHFAMQESRRVWNEADLAGMPHRPGIMARFEAYTQAHEALPGIKLLRGAIDYGASVLGFNAEEWLYELVDGIIGDQYPMPDRMLVHTEKIVHQFLLQEMCGSDLPDGNFQLFAVEGATAALCYIFNSLLTNYLLSPGDKIAIMVPIFPPYVEIPYLSRYDFDIVEIRARGQDREGRHTWQYPSAEIEKLADRSVKALFLVNPSNPPSVALAPATQRQIVDIVRNNNPELMIISDDVYATFADHYRSLMADLPFNTLGVYSFSKYFGVTGWRLGLIAAHQSNVFDALLRRLPQKQTEQLQKRYESLALRPDQLGFIDRLVADSREVALNHTAGLSTPQQVQMALLAAFALLDREERYKQLTRDICHRRMILLYEGLGLSQPRIPYDADYYTEFDLEEWSRYYYGREFTHYLQQHYKPIDILFQLAERSAIVLLHGGGFRGPEWSIRVSLANLDDGDYVRIGRELRKILDEYVAEWKAGI